MKRFTLLLVIFVFVFFACSSDDHNIDNSDSPTGSSFIVSSYIRGNFYNMGRISAESLNACTDLICIGASPNIDGSLIFDSFNLHNGEGVTTIEELIVDVKKQLTGATRVRLGVSGGEYWKDMIEDPTARLAFAQNVKTALTNLNVDGVDLDFEWATTSQELDNYSQTIVTLSQTLGSGYLLSISLDPYSYKLSAEAIEATAYFSLQCYGPIPTFFAYNNYVSAINNLISYGIHAQKLVPGVPFYGVAADGSKQTIAYYDLVVNQLIVSPSIDQATFHDVLYDFNGQDMIAKKTQYALQKQCHGMMSWDLATDVSFSNHLSLLRAMLNEISTNR